MVSLTQDIARKVLRVISEFADELLSMPKLISLVKRQLPGKVLESQIFDVIQKMIDKGMIEEGVHLFKHAHDKIKDYEIRIKSEKQVEAVQKGKEITLEVIDNALDKMKQAAEDHKRTLEIHERDKKQDAELPRIVITSEEVDDEKTQQIADEVTELIKDELEFVMDNFFWGTTSGGSDTPDEIEIKDMGHSEIKPFDINDYKFVKGYDEDEDLKKMIDDLDQDLNETQTEEMKKMAEEFMRSIDAEFEDIMRELWLSKKFEAIANALPDKIKALFDEFGELTGSEALKHLQIDTSKFGLRYAFVIAWRQVKEGLSRASQLVKQAKEEE
jgi:hypothetical protein